jgi:hypothetical protein
MAPEFPALVVPVLNDISPLTPVAPEFGVRREKAPEEVGAL